MVKHASSTYIDSVGKCFTYIKTKFCKLIYRKIQKVEKKGKYSLVWIYNINFPFKVPRPPRKGDNWAGILYINNLPWLLYNY